MIDFLKLYKQGKENKQTKMMIEGTMGNSSASTLSAPYDIEGVNITYRGSYTRITDPHEIAVTLAKELADMSRSSLEAVEDDEPRYVPVDEKFMAEIYVPALVELKQNGHCHPDFDPFPSPMDDDGYSDQTLLLWKEDQSGYSYISSIYEGDTTKGFILLSGENDWREMTIEFIHIIPEFRGMGESKKFLGRFLKEMNTFKDSEISITADIYISNKISQATFEEMGFTPYCLCYKITNQEIGESDES